MSYKGKFIPSNRKKYRGDINNIIYRSLWERKFMVHCDTKPEIIEWGSEEIIIPYFPDFYIKTNNGDKFMIEIKPKKFTKPPRATKRVTKAFLHETKEWARNCAKWTAAKAVCDRQGWKFLIFTEDHLNMTKYLYGR